MTPHPPIPAQPVWAVLPPAGPSDGIGDGKAAQGSGRDLAAAGPASRPPVPAPPAWAVLPQGKARPACVPTLADSGLQLSEVLGALSHALDITEGQPVGHSMRCCWIGYHLGEALGLDNDELGDLFHALLLKDLGCSSNAARLCALYLGDDHAIKRDFKLIGHSLPQVARFVLAHTGLSSGLRERFGAVLNIVQNGGELLARELVETRCERGADIARQMRFSEAVAAGIRDLDEHWDGHGRPTGLKGQTISLFARVALLAQVVDVFHLGGGRKAACREVRRRSGTWFDPDLAKVFAEIASSPAFWQGLAAPDLEAQVLALPPARQAVLLDQGYLDDIASGFAQVIDAKSPFTGGHSERVALYADLIAQDLGVDGGSRTWLKRTALLHDVGKLGVSNQILDKPGKLDEAEWRAMRAHAGTSETILARIGAFKGLARIAGAHHERLDGQGYPNRLKGSAIGRETRIISTADVFDALTADRPYRGAMPVDQAFAIMTEDSGTALDGDCVAALKRGMARVG